MTNSNQIRLGKLFYLFLFILTFTPLLAYFSLSGVNKVLYFYYKIIWVVIGIYFAVVYKPIWKTYHFYILLFALYLFIWSFFNGKIQNKGLFTFENSTNFALLFSTLILSNIKYTDVFIKRIIIVFKITVIFSLIVSVIQVFNPDFFNATELWNESSKYITGDIYVDRRISIFGFIDQNSLGLDYLPILILLLSFMFFENSKTYIIFIYYILGGITALLSNSRYIIIGYLISVALFFVYKKFNFLKSIRVLIFSIVLLYVLLYFLSLLGYNFKDWYEERLLQEGSIEETTRYKAIGNFLIMFPKKPLFGIGVETNDELLRLSHQIKSARIHVGYLAFPVSWGVLGSFLLFGSWFLILQTFYKNAKISGYWGSFFGFIIFIWANATFPKWHFFYYGLLFTFIFDKYFIDKYYNKFRAEKSN